MSHWAADQTIEFINSHDETKPFFAMMSIFDPHDPYADYPKDAASLIDASNIPDPLICDNEFEGKPADLLREHKSSYLGSFDKFSLDELRQIRFGYHVSIAYADREFGRVLDALDKKGLTENTLVIFTSDHGDMLGDHQLLIKGAFFYDPVTRVPLILRWPKGLQSGRRVNSLVQNLDIAATVLSAAGMDSEPIKKYMPDSSDLLPLAAGKVPFVREDAVCCYRNSGINTENTQSIYFDPPINATMIRHGKYKLNVWHNIKLSENELQGELYDMEGDRQELNNLWNDPDCSKVRQQLTGRLLNWSSQQKLRQRPRGGQTLPKAKMQNALK